MWTDERHEAVKARCKAASVGPWREREDFDYYLGGTYVVDKDGEKICLLFCDETDFVAEARTDLPDALAEIERLKRKSVRLCAEVGRLHIMLYEAQTQREEMQAQRDRLMNALCGRSESVAEAAKAYRTLIREGYMPVTLEAIADALDAILEEDA